mgnify:CR=1 FL=1
MGLKQKIGEENLKQKLIKLKLCISLLQSFASKARLERSPSSGMGLGGLKVYKTDARVCDMYSVIVTDVKEYVYHRNCNISKMPCSLMRRLPKVVI